MNYFQSNQTITIGNEQIKIINFIQRGNQGEVYKCVYSNNEYALKFYFNVELEEKRIIKQLINHQSDNLIRIYRTFEYMSHFIIIMDLCEGDGLSEFIEKNREINLRSMLYQIARGLQVIHKYGIIHRDIKPENILVKNDKFLITDFGLSKQCIETSTRRIGTPYYMAIELLQDHEAPYTNKIDIWALGALFYEMATKQILFYGESPREVYEKIIQYKYNQESILQKLRKLDLKEQLKKLIIDMLNPDPNKRPDIAKVVRVSRGIALKY